MSVFSHWSPLPWPNDAIKYIYETKTKIQKEMFLVMVERGLEPRTLGLLDPRSNQLSYTTALKSTENVMHIKMLL
jgi:hypothetical protein